MDAATGRSPRPQWSGCACCGDFDADAYVPIGEHQFLCYHCVDVIHATRQKHARQMRRRAWRDRVLRFRARRRALPPAR
jgi:hypothetical protein